MKTVVALVVPMVIGFMALKAHPAPQNAVDGLVPLEIEMPPSSSSNWKTVQGSSQISYRIIEGVVPEDTVLIHGNMASNNWWTPAAEVLTAKAAQVPSEKRGMLRGRLIMLEWPGYGKSSAPHSLDELRPDYVAAELIEVLKTLEVTRANIVGHSTGGAISLFMVEKAPKMFNRLFLLDSVGPFGLLPFYEPWALPLFEHLEEALARKDRAYVERMISMNIRNADPKSPLFKQLVDDAMNSALINAVGVPKVLFDMGRAAFTNGERALSRPIRHRAEIVFGEHDNILPPLQFGPGLKAMLPNARFRIMPGVGHSGQVDNPALFTDWMIESFGYDNVLKISSPQVKGLVRPQDQSVRPSSNEPSTSLGRGRSRGPVCGALFGF